MPAFPCDAFMQGYRNAPLTCEDLAPRRVGGKLGHMGYFRQAAEPLWERMLDGFSRLSRPAA